MVAWGSEHLSFLLVVVVVDDGGFIIIIMLVCWFVPITSVTNIKNNWNHHKNDMIHKNHHSSTTSIPSFLAISLIMQVLKVTSPKQKQLQAQADRTQKTLALISLSSSLTEYLVTSTHVEKNIKTNYFIYFPSFWVKCLKFSLRSFHLTPMDQFPLEQPASRKQRKHDAVVFLW